MGYKDFDGLDLGTQTQTHSSSITLQADGESINLPDASFVRDANLTRDGMDLVLEGPDGAITIEGYFSAEPTPHLVAPDGSSLTPELVNSFSRFAPEFAQGPALNDESPVGAVQEVSGEAKVTHMDGTVETISIGTAIYQGDIIETNSEGAVNVVFVDETSFAVSEDARLAIDEYVFDPSTQSGETNFSVLKGVFVFTSGLIGRDDPDDVHIDTPVGSIGIRGTIIAGNINTGEITVVEGAIVLRDFAGHEVTLANQFETAKFSAQGGIENIGQLSASDVAGKFSIISQVSPTLFSSINDAAAEQGPGEQTVQPDADGSVDQNSDNQVDGTVETAPEAPVPGEGAELAPPPVLQPLPLPLNTQTTFGTNTSGLIAPVVLQGPALPPPPPPTDVKAFMPPPVNSAGEPLPPPPVNPTDPNIDPNVIAGGGPTIGGTTNVAPVHDNVAPEAYFAGMQGQVWNYTFTKDFHDPNASNVLTFELNPVTVTLLNNLRDGLGGSPNILNTWNFNAGNGQLTLDFQSVFGSVAVGTNHGFDIEIRAIDNHGASTGWQNYSFDAWRPNGSASASFNGDNQVLSGSTGNDTIDIGDTIVSTNNTIFLGNGNDDVTITEGDDNYINLGNGQNTVLVSGATANIDNTIVGGDDFDSFTIFDAHNKFFGMGGDDNFTLNANAVTQLQSANPYSLIDGGSSAFRAGDALASQISKLAGFNDGNTELGRGDSLIFQGVSAIDFRNIDNNFIRGIERLDFVTDTATNVVNLSYQDVFEMTDQKKTLIINLGANDTLNFWDIDGSNNWDGQNGNKFQKVADNLGIDDARGNAATGSTADDILYDVYTDGNITLVVSDVGTVTGLPA